MIEIQKQHSDVVKLAYPDHLNNRPDGSEMELLPESMHTHDCEECEYMGSLRAREGDFDFYMCSNYTLIPPTFIARFGSGGSEYISRPEPVMKTWVPVEEPHCALKAVYNLWSSAYKSQNFQFHLAQEGEVMLVPSMFTTPRYRRVLEYVWYHVYKMFLCQRWITDPGDRLVFHVETLLANWCEDPKSEYPIPQ